MFLLLNEVGLKKVLVSFLYIIIPENLRAVLPKMLYVIDILCMIYIPIFVFQSRPLFDEKRAGPFMTIQNRCLENINTISFKSQNEIHLPMMAVTV